MNSYINKPKLAKADIDAYTTVRSSEEGHKAINTIGAVNTYKRTMLREQHSIKCSNA
jgi:hypothetical protein